MGELTAVAVWTEKPSADQLLARRLEHGWQPTSTPLQEGAKILGHAACLVRGGERRTAPNSLGSPAAG